ncbi:hypothetical protein EON67_07700 [archaeon]|nr:MAG: hypothetical protein EON67_07700 [archaeon]
MLSEAAGWRPAEDATLRLLAPAKWGVAGMQLIGVGAFASVVLADSRPSTLLRSTCVLLQEEDVFRAHHRSVDDIELRCKALGVCGAHVSGADEEREYVTGAEIVSQKVERMAAALRALRLALSVEAGAVARPASIATPSEARADHGQPSATQHTETMHAEDDISAPRAVEWVRASLTQRSLSLEDGVRTVGDGVLMPCTPAQFKWCDMPAFAALLQECGVRVPPPMDAGGSASASGECWPRIPAALDAASLLAVCHLLMEAESAPPRAVADAAAVAAKAATGSVPTPAGRAAVQSAAQQEAALNDDLLLTQGASDAEMALYE